jgi:hypothetical protein
MTDRHAKDRRMHKSRREQPDKVQNQHVDGKERERIQTANELNIVMQ